MKQTIANIIQKKIQEIFNVEFSENEIFEKIEMPDNKQFGDFAFSCFIVSKKAKASPTVIANKLAEVLTLENTFEKVEAVNAYLNIFINRLSFTKDVLNKILNSKQTNEQRQSKTVLIEFPSPNTNKPLHLGHVRNMAIGESLARILELTGNKVIRLNLINDRGIHICKSMLAYQKLGENKEPDKKLDHFVGDYYVMFNKLAKEDDSYNKEAQEMLVKWEQGDTDIRALWKKMNKWACDGFEETFRLFGVKHDQNYYESDIYNQGRDIVLEGLKDGIFVKREDSAVIANLTSEGLDQKVLLRADGTTIYITQDIYLAKLKAEQYHPDISIYIVGNEQDYHFKTLFAILKKLNFYENLVHLSYGMVELPEGRMKSREGIVVDADNLLNEVKELAKAEMLKRNENIDPAELDKKGLVIALAAIKYSLLKTNILKNMVFNPKESLSFDGDTGAYLLYSYARAFSILNKINERETNIDDINEIGEYEYELAKKINQFNTSLENAAKELNPSILAHFVFDLAKTFNEFYHACPVINGDNVRLRIALIKAFLQVFKKSLEALGIDVLEKM